MECFSHSSIAAVAACKSCGRGACRDCIQDLGFAVTCSDACALEARQTHEMNQRAKKIYSIGVNTKRFPLASTMWGGMALLFMGWSVFLYFDRGKISWFPIAFGMFMAVIGWLNHRRMKDLQLNC